MRMSGKLSLCTFMLNAARATLFHIISLELLAVNHFLVLFSDSSVRYNSAVQCTASEILLSGLLMD